MFLCIDLFAYVGVYVSVCVYACVYVYFYVYVYVHVFVFVCVFKQCGIATCKFVNPVFYVAHRSICDPIFR